MSSFPNGASIALLCLCTVLFAPTILAVGWQQLAQHVNGASSKEKPVGLNVPEAEREVHVGWIEQPLDHYDSSNQRTWQQRYLYSERFYQPGGPVFLLIGGESEINPSWLLGGSWIHTARRHNAIIIYLEHRFYGYSRPTRNTATRNLAYLTSHQAIGDVASFIPRFNDVFQLPQDSTKWVAFGGSYSATLAVWARQLHPNLIVGSVASSAPLRAQANFREYMEVVEKSIRTVHSDQCVREMAKSVRSVELMLQGPKHRRQLDNLFQNCDDLADVPENQLDSSNFISALAYSVANIVQYNNDNSPYALVGINQICDIMVNRSLGTPVERFAIINRGLLQVNGQPCLDYKYDKMIAAIQNTTWEADTSAVRQWTYQTCAEFGFYQISDRESMLFGNNFDLDFMMQQCVDIFGPEFSPSAQHQAFGQTNQQFGGNAAAPTNVIYVLGSIDPWSVLGFPNSPDANVVYIEGTAHCANMYEPRSDDSYELKAARIEVDAFVDDLLA